jgi:hypothetical protein
VVRGGELVSEHLFEAVLALDGLDGVERQFKHACLRGEIKPIPAGVRRDIMGMLDGVAQDERATLVAHRDQLAPGAHLRHVVRKGLERRVHPAFRALDVRAVVVVFGFRGHSGLYALTS